MYHPNAKITRSEDGNIVVVDHQPGNMTRYVGIGTKLPGCGIYKQGTWLISFPEFGSSYVVDEGMYLSRSYVAEKFGQRRSGIKPFDADGPDLSEMAKVIAMIVPETEIDPLTDNTGHISAPPK